jgi:hypothetical protein
LPQKLTKSTHQASQLGRRETPRKSLIVIGVAVVLLVAAVFAVRLAGIRPHRTASVSTHIDGAKTSHAIQNDAALLTTASNRACARPGGWQGWLGMRGPAKVLVVASADVGGTQRFSFDCKTQQTARTG